MTISNLSSSQPVAGRAMRKSSIASGTAEIILIHDLTDERGPGQGRIIEGVLDAAFEDKLLALEEIHQLRIFLIDDDSRLVIIAHFSGLVADFLAKLAIHLPDELDLIWSQCEGYPQGGARDCRAFIDFIYLGYMPSHFFFTAYPDTSVKQIWRALDWTQKTLDFQRSLARPTPARVRPTAGQSRAA